ncbi:sushi domain-containing protein 2-like [Mytilus californianus]|uniref:sushi domain-containing protein 2-like n=1 Tax=Mytilus californianus TaxID=6549 RepID=UPI0022457F9C|nr:sushi domain-containing protein 2-like [Mytilus californianus]
MCEYVLNKAVNTNGAISFDETLSTYTPSAFPLNGNKKIVAPFWCDIDTTNGGDVWYYETNNQDVLFKATDDIQKIFPEQTNFRAAWVFVATWDHVAFYGASSTGQRKRNTFQCILITNGRHSFAIFLYNKIEWTTGSMSGGNANTGLGGTPAQVGFDAGDGHNYMAIRESRTPAVKQVASLSNVKIEGNLLPSGWSDVFVMLPPDAKSLLSACYAWDDREEKHRSLERNQIDTCPCTIAQARLDISRFNPDPHCNTLDHNIDNDTSINCIYHVGALQCLRMAFPGNMGHDNQCCYNSDGNLIETNAKTFGGTANRYHYKGGAEDNIPYLSNIYDDVVPYMYCCQYPAHYNLDLDSCQRFLRRRPPSRCSGYIPPRAASSRGDPHLVTLDGLDYTFNGVGEFTMIQSKDNHLILQARMEQFKDKHGNLKQASVITSVALRCNNDSDIVEMRLNEIRMCDVLINGQLLEFMNTNTVDVNGATIINSRGNDTNIESIWTSVTCRYPNIAVNVTAMAKMININIVIAGNSLRGFVKGLLGNFNGKQNDDLTNAYDRIIPINSSLDIIHHKFGLTWQINASDSLFTYPVGKTHQSFQHVDFKPVFNVTDQCPGNVAYVCGDDQACRFDFCTTDDTSLAESTRIMTDEIEVMAEVALPACGEPGNITEGYWNFTGKSANLLCNENYISNGQTLIMCSDDGQWSVINTTCELKRK